MKTSPGSDAGAGRWYALRVRTSHEKVVSTVLRSKGLEDFLPTYQARRQWSDRIVNIELPLFAGYVFCHFDLLDRKLPVVTTPGVLQIVGFGRTPAPLDDSEIEAVQAIVRSGLPAEPWEYVPAGELVRIDKGPLCGASGVFRRVKKRHQLIVSVSLLQRSVAVEIDSAWVTPARGNWRAEMVRASGIKDSRCLA